MKHNAADGLFTKPSKLKEQNQSLQKVSSSPARLRLDVPDNASLWQAGEVLAGGPQF
jgi:hypothetical protein